jgi:hypothetical protein
MGSSYAMFRSRSNQQADDVTQPRRRRSSLTAQSLVVAGAAVVSGLVLLLTGALDGSRHVDIDPATQTTISAAAPATPAANSVMMIYLRAIQSWTDCMNAPTSATGPAATSCGTAPDQPDDAQLNAYLAAVLEWQKCASPRLHAGGIAAAEIACGPQPASPLGS